MKLRFVLVRYLANLQFAIILLLTIASFSILGSIIEQDQTIDFYKNAYSQPWFGIFTSNIILQFGLDHIFKTIPFESNKPNLIIANTSKGKGISFIENVVSWHHRVPSDEEYKLAIEELNLEHEKLIQ